MKLIEALKALKRLNVKLDDLKTKIKTHCAHSSIEQPEYGGEQRQRVQEWIDSYHDTCKEILRLRVAIQRTNLSTPVTIEIGDNKITRSIAEWIHRRRDLAKSEADMWKVLNDRHVRQGQVPSDRPDGKVIEIKSVVYYDPMMRDRKVSEYTDEPSLIDAQLEITNAVTDLIEQ